MLVSFAQDGRPETTIAEIRSELSTSLVSALMCRGMPPTASSSALALMETLGSSALGSTVTIRSRVSFSTPPEVTPFTVTTGAPLLSVVMTSTFSETVPAKSFFVVRVNSSQYSTSTDQRPLPR